MKLVLPYPPTANKYWRVFRGTMVKSPLARRYQNAARLTAVMQRAGQETRAPYHGPVAVAVVVYRPRRRGDLDNTLKVLLDALKGVAFVDDDQVVRIEADRRDDKSNPRVEVEILPMRGEAQ